MTYEEATKMLGGIPRRKFMANTFLSWEDKDTIAVEFYHKPIVLIHRDGSFTLNSWERMSKVTVRRIMAFAPVKLKTRDYHTTVTARDGGATCPFEDGMRVNQHGEKI